MQLNWESVIQAPMPERISDGANLFHASQLPRMSEILDEAGTRYIDGTAEAALDVFEIEPLPPEHPLWRAPNFLLTPHVTGNGPYLETDKKSLFWWCGGAWVQG